MDLNTDFFLESLQDFWKSFFKTSVKSIAYLSSFVWQFSACDSLLITSSKRPYGRLRPSDDVTCTIP